MSILCWLSFLLLFFAQSESLWGDQKVPLVNAQKYTSLYPGFVECKHSQQKVLSLKKFWAKVCVLWVDFIQAICGYYSTLKCVGIGLR